MEQGADGAKKQGAIIGFGTATLLPDYGLHPVARSESENLSLLRKAVEMGVPYIDTAPAYGNGEKLLGGLADLLNAQQVRLCTKIVIQNGGLNCDEVIKTARASLDRLRRHSVDTVLLHSAARDLISNSKLAEHLRMLKGIGFTKRTGASTYGIEDAGLATGMPWCDALQVEYSILNQSVVRAIAGVKRPDQELVVRSVLCKGLLTDRRRYADLSPPLIETLGELSWLASRWGYILPELAIRFALDTPGVDVVLVGISTEEELDLAWKVWQGPALSLEQMEILRAFDCSHFESVHPEGWS